MDINVRNRWMMGNAILDTGPLVAFLDRRDRQSDRRLDETRAQWCNDSRRPEVQNSRPDSGSENPAPGSQREIGSETPQGYDPRPAQAQCATKQVTVPDQASRVLRLGTSQCETKRV